MQAKYNISSNLIFTYNAIINAIKNVNVGQSGNTENDRFFFKEAPSGSLGRKLFYKSILKPEIPLCHSIWRRKYNIIINENHWENIISIKESRLKSLSWKILHNIYPTNILLFKMKIAESDLCNSCKEKDFIEHFFFRCQRIRDLWQEVSKDIYCKCGIKIKITEEVVLLGFVKSDNISNKQIRTINYYLAIGRLVISKYKYGI